MMAGHDGSSALGTVAYSTNQVHVVIELSPEMIAVVPGGISHITRQAVRIIGEVPFIERFTGCRNVQQVVRVVIANNVSGECIGITGCGISRGIAHVHTIIIQRQGGRENIGVSNTVSRGRQHTMGQIHRVQYARLYSVNVSVDRERGCM